MPVVITQYTYASFVSEAMTRKKHNNNGESSRCTDFSFTQSKSIEEAHHWAVNGWDLGLEQYKIEDGLLVGGFTEMNPSIAGCLPHVQNHIMGFPEQMYGLYDNREYNLPTLDLVLNLAYAGRVSGSDALEFGKSIVSYINAMASNYNIRVTGIFASNQSNNTKTYEVITLKDFDSALVINNIAFAFHPSFFRRIWFSIAEQWEYLSGGYGSAITEYREVAKTFLTGGESDKTIYFRNLQDISTFKWNDKNIDKVIF